ncbi:MAG: nitroreductase [Mesorhizobium sp.]|nr:nitroreductase [Mesorhizobium sp.]MCO5164490.1 nitroreductase [Mesorhizobium sp.]
MTTAVIDFLSSRKSAPIDLMTEPGPSEAEIETMIRIASRVPDHGRLAPWRFILYRGDARHEIGERLAALAQELEGPLPEARLAKERSRFSRAPLVIGVISLPRDDAKNIPPWEKFLSGGAAAMNLSLAANALGYGANWITNWYSDTAEGRRILGLEKDERVIGFVHIGTFKGEIPERPRPDIAKLVSEYAGPTRS